MALTALPDIKVRKITKDTEFIICACDGIWDCKTSDQAVQYFKQQLPLMGTNIKDIQNVNHNMFVSSHVLHNVLCELRH